MELAGNFFLWTAVVFAGLAAASGILAAWGDGRVAGRWIELALRSMTTSALSGLASVGLLSAAFFLDDFRIRSVQVASSRDLSPWFKVSLLWVDLETSMLFWAFVLASVSALALRGQVLEVAGSTVENSAQAGTGGGQSGAIRWAGVAALIYGALAALFFAVVLVRYNPFDPYLVERPLYGAGMKPMLRNFWMLIHPPIQYLGYGLSLVPFSLLMSALVTNRPLDKELLRLLRPWVLATWLALALGMALGMVWAYGEVDWGGYWNWDPVENASLMPFLMGTVGVHALLLGTRGRWSRGWLVFSLSATFWLTILGAFLTRTGAVDSVHSFGKDSFLLRVLGGLLLMGLAASMAVLWWRRGLWQEPESLSGGRRFDFRTALTLCNWVLTAAVVVVLVGSVGPLLWKIAAGRTIKVQRSFFETWLLPVGPLAGFLVGLAYGLAAPGTKSKRSWLRFLPGLAGAIMGLVLTARLAGPSFWAMATGVGAGFALGQALFSAVWMGIARRRPKPAAVGFIHVGLALLLLGLSGRGGLVRAQEQVAAGSELVVGGQGFQYLGAQVRDDLEANRVFALLRSRGRVVRPGLLAYLSSPQMPVGRTETIPTMWKDLQVRLLAVQSNGTATLQIVIHPLASWMWAGFVCMALAGLALLLGRPAAPTRFMWVVLAGWLLGSLGLGGWFWIAGRPAMAGTESLLAAPAAALALPASLALASLAWWLGAGLPPVSVPRVGATWTLVPTKEEDA